MINQVSIVVTFIEQQLYAKLIMQNILNSLTECADSKGYLIYFQSPVINYNIAQSAGTVEYTTER